MKKFAIILYPSIALIFTALIWFFVSTGSNTPPLQSLPETESVPIFSEYLTRDGKININTATAKELQLIPGIGEKLAERIIAYRTENGPFTEPDDLYNIKGITKEAIADAINYIGIE